MNLPRPLLWLSAVLLLALSYPLSAPLYAQPSPVLADPTTGALTRPALGGNLVSTTATQTLTNKTLTAPVLGNATVTSLTFPGNASITGSGGALNITGTIGAGTGSTAPVTEFQIVSTSSSAVRGIMSAQYSDTTGASQFIGRKARGTFGVPSTITSGDSLAALIGEGYDGVSYLQMGSIAIKSLGTISTNRVPSKIVFSTATNAAPSVLTEAVTIDETQAIVGGAAGLVIKASATNDTNITLTPTRFGNVLISNGGLTLPDNATQAGALSLGSYTSGTNYGLLTTSASTSAGLRIESGVNDTPVTLAPKRFANVVIANGGLTLPDNATQASILTLGSYTSGTLKAYLNASSTATNGLGFMLAGSEKMLLTSTALTLASGLSFAMAAPSVPASASASGVAGTISWDTNYIYVCVATNTWKRVAIATW